MVAGDSLFVARLRDPAEEAEDLSGLFDLEPVLREWCRSFQHGFFRAARAGAGCAAHGARGSTVAHRGALPGRRRRLPRRRRLKRWRRRRKTTAGACERRRDSKPSRYRVRWSAARAAPQSGPKRACSMQAPLGSRGRERLRGARISLIGCSLFGHGADACLEGSLRRAPGGTATESAACEAQNGDLSREP